MFQYNHVAPNGIGATFLFRPKEIFKVIDKREVQLFQRNIITLVGMRNKLTDMVADRPIACKCPLRPAVPDFLLKLGVVLLEQL